MGCIDGWNSLYMWWGGIVSQSWWQECNQPGAYGNSRQHSIQSTLQGEFIFRVSGGTKTMLIAFLIAFLIAVFSRVLRGFETPAITMVMVQLRSDCGLSASDYLIAV